MTREEMSEACFEHARKHPELLGKFEILPGANGQRGWAIFDDYSPAAWWPTPEEVQAHLDRAKPHVNEDLAKRAEELRKKLGLQ